MNNYYTKIGQVNLGDLSKVNLFMEQLSHNVHTLDEHPTGTPIHTDMNLNAGTDLVCMRYGKHNGFYTVKGYKLQDLFDDWEGIQQWVESKVGETAERFPLITFTKNHIFKHVDLNRPATVNMGLWNSTSSNTLFWEGDDIVASVRYDVGEAIFANVTKMHSVILNDSPSFFRNRAILMWTVNKKYE